MFEKDMHFGMLLDFYGDMLTERQREMLDCYYNNDMSLSEISDAVGISRQGVRSAVKKATDILSEMEEKLGLASRFVRLQTQLNSVSNELSQVRQLLDDPAICQKVDNILIQLNELDEI